MDYFAFERNGEKKKKHKKIISLVIVCEHKKDYAIQKTNKKKKNKFQNCVKNREDRDQLRRKGN